MEGLTQSCSYERRVAHAVLASLEIEEVVVTKG